MVLHVLNRTKEPNEYGEIIGQGIHNLVQKKISDLQTRQGIETRKSTYQKAGLPEWLAELPDNMQTLMLKEYDFAPPAQKREMQDMLSTMDPSYFEEEKPKAESTIPGLNTLANAGAGLGQSERPTGSPYQAFPEDGRGTRGEPSPSMTNLQQSREPEISTRPVRGNRPTGLRRKSAIEAERKQANEDRRIDVENEKLVRENFAQTKKDREQLLEQYKAARRDLADLDRFEQLEQTGKLDTPGYVEFLERSGLDIPALMNPESEEFKKIAANFIRDAKNTYGGRVTNQEMMQFLQTIPSLSQSPEGRKRVIANMKRLKRAEVERYKASRDITSRNKGVPPLDLAEQVEEVLDSRLDKLSEQFIKDLAKKVPEGQNRLITGLQAAGGGVVGAPGKLLNAIGGLISRGG